MSNSFFKLPIGLIIFHEITFGELGSSLALLLTLNEVFWQWLREIPHSE